MILRFAMILLLLCGFLIVYPLYTARMQSSAPVKNFKIFCHTETRIAITVATTTIEMTGYHNVTVCNMMPV